MAALRIVFMGTAPLSCASLKALCTNPAFQVIAVVTQPDRPKGRDLKRMPSPVKEAALAANFPVLQPERARDEAFVQALSALQPDLIVVAAYGQILPKSILDLSRFGCLNVHTSLLPRYRGAAPIQWALLNGDLETGVTIMKMDQGLDTGEIVTQAITAIMPEDDASSMYERLAQMGADLLVRTVPEFVSGKLQPRPQPSEGLSYAPKIKKQDGLIDWTQPARVIWNRIRALVPWPGAFSYFIAHEQSHLLKVWQAQPVERQGQPGEILQADKAGLVVGCGQEALRILVLQREGGRRLTSQEFLAGHPMKPGEHLGASKRLDLGDGEAPISKHQAPEKIQDSSSNSGPSNAGTPT